MRVGAKCFWKSLTSTDTCGGLGVVAASPIRSAWEGTDLSLAAALANEFTLDKATHDTGESQAGPRRFAQSAGRHGRF